MLELIKKLLEMLDNKQFTQILEQSTLAAYGLGLATGGADMKLTRELEPDIDSIASIGIRTQALSEQTMAQAKGNLAFEADKLYTEMDAAVKAGMSQREALSQIETRVRGLFENSFEEWKLERLVRDQVLVATKEGRRDGWQEGGAKYRQWKAHLDKKTGEDSKRMNGQIAAIDEPYTDPKTGDKYMIPHIRPNDRCFEIPLFELPEYTTKNGLMYAKGVSGDFTKGGPGSGIKGHTTAKKKPQNKYTHITSDDERLKLIQKWERVLFEDGKVCDEVKHWSAIVKRGITSKTMNQKSGKYTPERTKNHKAIINHFQNNTPAIGKPRVVFFGGPSGSGKSGLMKYIKNSETFTYVNNDDIKEMLPEYNGLNSIYLHEEARDIISELEQTAIKNKGNLIIDGTMKDHTKSIKLYEKYKKAGYEIIQLSTNLPLKNTMERAVNRTLSDSGRYVPMGLIADTAEDANINQFKMLSLADKGAVFDTNVNKGEPYKLIKRK